MNNIFTAENKKVVTLCFKYIIQFSFFFKFIIGISPATFIIN